MNVGNEVELRHKRSGVGLRGANEGLTVGQSKIRKRSTSPVQNLVRKAVCSSAITTAFASLGNDKRDLKHKQLIENTVTFTSADCPRTSRSRISSNVSFPVWHKPEAIRILTLPLGTISGESRSP